MKIRLVITGTIDLSEEESKIEIDRVYIHAPSGFDKNKIDNLKVTAPIFTPGNKLKIVVDKVDISWISGHFEPVE